MREKKRIYLDNAAATPVRKEVKKAMSGFWDIDFGNAGALHQEGCKAKQALTQAREKIAKILGTSPTELIFNSGGTEANNLAIFGVINQARQSGLALKKMHLITTVMEHPSVLSCFEYLKKEGARLDLARIDENGIIDLKQFKKILCEQTVLISIMLVNNEIGVIQPISEIVKIIQHFKKNSKSARPILHSDAAQALLYLPVNIQKLGIDLISFDSQKIYGPKGAGLLYVKKGVQLAPYLMGGKQEKGLRPGTENIPAIVGFATALELASQEREKEFKRLTKLRDYFIAEILEKIPNAKLNGDVLRRLPNNVNISLPNIQNEFAVIQLDEQGIACSTKSACLTGKHSYVIEALEKGRKKTNNALRFTLGRQTSKKDIEYVIKCLVEICKK